MNLNKQLESYFEDIPGVSLEERVKIMRVELELDGLLGWDVKIEGDNERLVIYYRGTEERI